ncbi:MAG: SRPBCC family protein [Actinomycetota bacterium]|nr:SRPBCC family protein [Actinomycetota bacterium]
MRISSDRSYRFDVGPDALWEAITDVDRFRDWWPWLHHFDARGLEPGDTWHCTVQPPLPYTLSFQITIGDVTPSELVDATVTGEISGTAQIRITPDDGGGCSVRLTSQLAPASRFLQTIARVARPVVSLGHDWVLDSGARQFRHHLRSR